MSEKSKKIAGYDGRYDKLLGTKLPRLDIMQSEGLEKHILKRHPFCMKYLEKVSEIIDSPDYVGMNPKEKDSFELIKIYEENVLVAIKLDVKNDYFFVATIHEIKEARVQKRLFSGRLKKVNREC